MMEKINSLFIKKKKKMMEKINSLIEVCIIIVLGKVFQPKKIVRRHYNLQILTKFI